MTMRNLAMLVVLAVLTLVGAGCGDRSVVASGTGPADLDGRWVLVDATIDGSPLAAVDGYPITLEIDGDRIGGNAGCNGFGGTFTADGTALQLHDVAITEMACADPAPMAIESRFIQGFWRSSSIERSGDTLQLDGESVSLTYRAVAPTPDAAFVGTDWILDTFIDGDAAGSTTAGADEAGLTFADDGTFAGRTGCRDLAGTYDLADEALSLMFAIEKFACDGTNGIQDGQVLAVLQQPTLTVEVVESRLTLTAEDGTGLSFRAAQS